MGQSFEEASFDLGAGPVATFRQVTLPRLAPEILVGGLLAFTFSFDDFYMSFFVSGVDSETLRSTSSPSSASESRRRSTRPRR